MTPATVTPEWLAHNLLVEAGVGIGFEQEQPNWLLDPCAGTGSILQAARQRGVGTIEFVELNQQKAEVLLEQGFTGRRGDMQLMTPNPNVTAVVMNPDFRKDKWVNMICWARRLAPNAHTLVSVVPGDWHTRWQLTDWPTSMEFKNLLTESCRFVSRKIPHDFHIDDVPVTASTLKLNFV